MNARTVAVREYHYIFCAVVARKLLNLLPGAVLVARLSRLGKENPAGIASWRTRRMARRKRDVSDLPYAAPPLSCAAFFVKVLERFCRGQAAERGTLPVLNQLKPRMKGQPA